MNNSKLFININEIISKQLCFHIYPKTLIKITGKICILSLTNDDISCLIRALSP